jgi:hypothetical protein
MSGDGSFAGSRGMRFRVSTGLRGPAEAAASNITMAVRILPEPARAPRECRGQLAPPPVGACSLSPQITPPACRSDR